MDDSYNSDSDDSNIIYILRDGNFIPFHVPDIAYSDTEYPKDWFSANKSKPEIEIKLSKDSSLENARNYCHEFLRGEQISRKAIVEYLYYTFQNISDQLEDDWTSYGQTIRKGTITPLDLIVVNTQQTENVFEIKNPINLNEQDDLYLVVMLMGLYRIANAHESNQLKTTEMVKKTLNSISFNNRLLNCLTSAKKNYIKDYHHFNFMASALDMFLDKFPNNKYCKARIGSKALRYKACSGFESVLHLAELMGLESFKDVFNWCVDYQFHCEYRRMFEKKFEEVDKKDSYFPYAKGFGIVGKSAYSATENPKIHLLAHTVGCLLHNPRSLNVQKPNGNTSPIKVAENAAFIFVSIKNGRINNSSKVKWISLDKNDYEMSVAVEGIGSTRENSMGNWVKTEFLKYIKNQNKN